MSRLKKQHREKSGLELAQECARIALDTKAEDLIILDVRGLTSFTDFFVIMSGRSTRHVQGLADAIAGELSAKRISSKNCEGLKEGLWVLLDYSDVVVHIFYKETRAFYDLDGLWHDAPRVAPAAPAPGQEHAAARRAREVR
jgi:ribosome-associated protein